MTTFSASVVGIIFAMMVTACAQRKSNGNDAAVNSETSQALAAEVNEVLKRDCSENGNYEPLVLCGRPIRDFETIDSIQLYWLAICVSKSPKSPKSFMINARWHGKLNEATGDTPGLKIRGTVALALSPPKIDTDQKLSEKRAVVETASNAGISIKGRTVSLKGLQFNQRQVILGLGVGSAEHPPILVGTSCSYPDSKALRNVVGFGKDEW